MQRLCTIVRFNVTLFVLICHSTKIGGEKMERTEGSFCRPFPGIAFEGSKIDRLENGSLLYDKLVYPAGSYRAFENKTYGCICNLRTCLRKCCKRNEILGKGDRPNCVRLSNGSFAPDLVLEQHQLATEWIEGTSGLSKLFVLVEDMQCPENMSRYMLEPERYDDDAFVLQANGTLETVAYKFAAWNYCLDWKESFEKVVALVCSSDSSTVNSSSDREEYFDVGLVVSIPFFFATFFVYAIIPELRNLYGKTLMCYVGCLILAYTFLVLAKLNYLKFIFCSTIAFIIYFSFLASFFWLNVMCFDIWWTFGGFRSLRGSVMQRERKKFLIYSIYAWGCALILTGVCVIVDFFPDIPEYVIKPQFGRQNCWFTTRNARAVYFYGPMGVTVFCNICLFISTALKIVQHKKNTAQQLKGTDSRRHDDNKQWFNLYLKLFIVMGINWSMEIVSWLCDNSPAYIWYLTDLTNTLQGVIIFLIFVWKDKVKRLLLKRFGCRGSNVLSRTRSTCHSSAVSRTSTLTTQFQEKIDLYSNDPSGKSIVDN
ncbi:probable G-protein coupled receptor Mth-like 3 isoform X2 [Frieseomelitta varia]|uniref:probable G-protein coupled receptor Mth-like 3 isoform X2 n=1 Tax=Frieseomelitta varia TaxID=561572 RepID=UPI001CB6AC0F|nr:probable G-protein coupled receptor Mth-like 3 isoform X2 [Frieseomelitta varia]